MDATHIVIGKPAAERQPRSLRAPARSRARRTRWRPAGAPQRAAATVLRRFAARLDPSYS